MSRSSLFLLFKDRRLTRSRLGQNHTLQQCAAWYFMVRNRVLRIQAGRRGCPNEIAIDAEIHPSAFVSDSDVRIGPRVRVGAGAVIHKHVTIGEDSVIAEGTVIGSGGYEYRRLAGNIIPIVHMGGVRIGARTVIGPRTVIDRAVLSGEDTCIGDEVIVGALVNIAHAVEVGEGCVIEDGVTIAGHTVFARHARLGRNASFADGLSVGESAVIGPGTVVTRNLADAQSNIRRPADEATLERTVLRDLPDSKIMEWIHATL